MSLAPIETRREDAPSAAADLERALANLYPRGFAILERRPGPYFSTFPLVELALETPSGVEWLVWKDLSRGAAWRARPVHLRDPSREIEVYRDRLDGAGLETPAFRGAAVDPARGRYWLFLERVEGIPLWQVGDRGIWQEAARWLARLHARFAPMAAAGPGSLPLHDALAPRFWIERARRFLPAGALEGRDLAELERRATRAAARAAEETATLLHGEFHPSNVLVEEGTRIRPVDWESAARGPGELDLAALCSGLWTGEERAALVEAYLDGWRSAGAASPDARELAAAVDRARLLLAVRWLGWARSWTPPPHQVHDWLSTALTLAGEIEP